MYCDACGTDNPEGSAACRVCGRALRHDDSATRAPLPAARGHASGERGATVAQGAVATAVADEATRPGVRGGRPAAPAHRARRPRPRRAIADSLVPALRSLTGDGRRQERLLLIGVILAAFLVRVWALGTVPPYLTTDETATLDAAFRVAAAWGPGLFGLDWRVLPALDSYLLALFVAFFGNAAVSVRLVSAIVGASAVVPFFLLARRSMALWPALGATVVFGSSFWLLSLSRTGTDDVWPVAILVWGLWSVRVALERGSLWWWAGAGLWCALGLYGPPPGHLVIVVVALLAIATIIRDRLRGPGDGDAGATSRGRIRRRLVGLELLLCVTLVLVLPQVAGPTGVPAMPGAPQAPSQDATAIPWSGGALFWPAPVLGLGLAPPGVPILDVLTTFFAVVGLITAWRRGGAALTWYLTLGVCLVLGWAAVRETPGSTWGALALVPVAAFAGFGFDAVVTALPPALETRWQPLAAAAALVIAALNVWGYAAWTSLPASALPIASVLPMTQYPAWRQDAVQLAATGAAPPALPDWLAHAPPAPAPAAPSAAPATSPAPASSEPAPLARVSPTVAATFQRFLTGSDADRWVSPHGVAVDQQGTVYVADPGAHVVHRLDVQGGALSPLTIDAQSQAQPWDLAIMQDGSLLVDDAEAGVLYKVPSGQPPAPLGTLHFGKPRGISVGSDGAVLVAETAGNRIVIVSPDGQRLGQINAGQGSPPVLDQPTGVAQLTDGGLVVAEPNAQRLEKVSSNGDYLGAWTFPKSDTFNAPHLAALPDGVAVTDPIDHQVLVLDLAMQVVGVVGASGSGDGQFATPTGVAAGPDGGTLYVVDSGLDRVAVFKLARQ